MVVIKFLIDEIWFKIELCHVKSLEEELWLLCKCGLVLDAVAFKDAVIVDPFHHLEWGENLAVVEPCGGTDRVAFRSAHHR